MKTWYLIMAAWCTFGFAFSTSVVAAIAIDGAAYDPAVLWINAVCIPLQAYCAYYNYKEWANA